MLTYLPYLIVAGVAGYLYFMPSEGGGSDEVSLLPGLHHVPVPMPVKGPTFKSAVDSLAYCRARLGATDLLDDKTKAAIDTLTLALVAGSDKE